ncbi:hypothetical protein Tco_1000822 [Tanacetum coccineum]
MSTSPPHAADEASEREEEDAVFLARSRPIGSTSRTSFSEPSASSFKFKPPYAEPENDPSKFANTAPIKSRDRTHLHIPHTLFDT